MVENPAGPTDAESAGTLVSPRNAIVIANQRWVDDTVEEIDFTAEENAGNDTLDPGEELTAAEILSTRSSVRLAVSAGATTAHGADIDGDGQNENIVRYRFEHKPSTPSDQYNELPGLSTTLPLGNMGTPTEFLAGKMVGPAVAYRVVVENRSDQFSNPQPVPVSAIGAELHARAIRGDF